uniref:Uncharacterized protein n=1 Tax=Arundo donax TaxID=35708 RepID=A0A0A9A1Y8_ARUDO
MNMLITRLLMKRQQHIVLVVISSSQDLYMINRHGHLHRLKKPQYL